MSTLMLYFHTLRHLRPAQFRHQVMRRVRPLTPVRAVREIPFPRTGITPVQTLCAANGAVLDSLACRFLNVERPAPEGPFDWVACDLPKLWRYNLHYFDYLLDPALAYSRKSALLDDWIARVPSGATDAWEPYPLSLRIVNWVKFFLQERSAGRLPRPAWLSSLQMQAAWLERNLERHLLANHLLKNATALIFAGAYLRGRHADRWLRQGSHLLIEQVGEQFLEDGGHYERSPMYHAISLLDCVDALQILRQPPLAPVIRSLAPRGEQQLAECILAATQFLHEVAFPDGEIPLFNDAAFGIAPRPATILNHIRAAGVRVGASSAADRLIDKPHSGYFGFRRGGDMLLIDCGPVGPNHQPGHAHCDTLSYELSLDGSRVIVDTGVYDYELGQRRQLCRGTAGHNTVALDAHEQSEIWAGFRVARRAHPLAAAIERSGEVVTFEGSHDGYCRLRGHPIHRRRVRYDGNCAIEFTDSIEGAGEHSAESRIRLHPDCRAVIDGKSAHLMRGASERIARLEWLGCEAPEVQRGKYFPEFGRELDCEVLVLKRSGPLPLRFGYRILKECSA